MTDQIFILAMGNTEEEIVIRLSHEEAMDLFLRCLRSQDDDTETSVAFLRQLAKLLNLKAPCESAKPFLRLAA